MAQQEHPTKEVLSTISVQPTDVILGKGKAAYMSTGNRRLLAHVEQVLSEYEAATLNHDKISITRRLVEQIKSEGGRFLSVDLSGTCFEEVNDEQARTKVRTAIRRRIRAKNQQSGNPATVTSSVASIPSERVFRKRASSSLENPDDSEENKKPKATETTGSSTNETMESLAPGNFAFPDDSVSHLPLHPNLGPLPPTSPVVLADAATDSPFHVFGTEHEPFNDGVDFFLDNLSFSSLEEMSDSMSHTGIQDEPLSNATLPNNETKDSIE